jgi:inner membrane protein
MDSITHIVLGAAIGELMAGKKLGKKVLLVGAVAQSLPDIDFVASFWLDTSRDVWTHRGITHSFLFVLLLTPLLAAVAWRVYRSAGMSVREWCLFFGLQLFVHIFIDAFNAYGTGWFEPFNHTRISFNVLFVADPFYSCWLGLSFLALVILKKNAPSRKAWARMGLLLSSLYLCYCLGNKWRIDTRARRDLDRGSVHYNRYFSTPAPFNSWLWYVAAEDSNGYHTGYLSVFDHQPVSFRWQPRNDSLLAPLRARRDVSCLLRFAGGYYTIDRWKDTLQFNVLRFGEMEGWSDPRARFVFHYFLDYPDDNILVVQRGRFAGWDRQMLLGYIRRIRGN